MRELKVTLYPPIGEPREFSVKAHGLKDVGGILVFETMDGQRVTAAGVAFIATEPTDTGLIS